MSSTALETRVELAQLADLLGCAPAELDGLAPAPPEALRELRTAVTECLFDADRAALSRMAAAGRIVPVPLLARLAENVFGPLLCARIAGLFDSARAAEVAGRLSPGFLADTAAELDPRQASDLVARLPVERIAVVAGELERRGAYSVLGRFVGHLPAASLGVSVDALSAEGLVRTAYVLEAKDRIADIFDRLDARRRVEVVAVVERLALYAEAVELLRHLDPEPQRQLARVAADAAPISLARLRGEARQLGVETELAPFLSAAASAEA